MKKYKKTLTVIIILVVAFLMFASFFGVYKKNKNGDNVSLLPDFKLGMEFEKTRVITVAVNQESTRTVYDAEGNVVEEEEGVEYTEENGYKIEETPINDASLKNLNNYNIEKKIIEKRLKDNKVSQYSIDMNEITGKIKVEIPEDDRADEIQNLIQSSGGFMLLDSSTFEVVFSDDYLKKAEVMYSQGDIETGVFLQLKFNDEGTKKLQELSKIYVETEEDKQENEVNNETEAVNETDGTETANENQEEETSNEKTVWVIVNGALLGTTHLPDIMYDEKIMLTYGVSSDREELEEAMENANEAAILLNSGSAPLVYEYSNETVESSIDEGLVVLYVIGIGLVFVLAYIYLVIKFKAKGFITVYFEIGYLAVLLLILRLTNVTLTMEGMAGIVISMVLEYIFSYIVLDNMKKDVDGMYKKANLEFFLYTLPIYVIAVVFTFAMRANISSFGMTLFWGIILIYIYNFIFPKFIFENLNRRS